MAVKLCPSISTASFCRKISTTFLNPAINRYKAVSEINVFHYYWFPYRLGCHQLLVYLPQLNHTSLLKTHPLTTCHPSKKNHWPRKKWQPPHPSSYLSGNLKATALPFGYLVLLNNHKKPLPRHSKNGVYVLLYTLSLKIPEAPNF